MVLIGKYVFYFTEAKGVAEMFRNLRISVFKLKMFSNICEEDNVSQGYLYKAQNNCSLCPVDCLQCILTRGFMSVRKLSPLFFSVSLT